jgi:hypothetical protein
MKLNSFLTLFLAVLFMGISAFAQTSSSVTMNAASGDANKVVTWNYWVDSSYTVNSTDKSPNGASFNLDGYVSGDSNNSLGFWYSSTAAHTGGARDSNAYKINIQTNPNGVWVNVFTLSVGVSGTTVIPAHVITNLSSLFGPSYRFQVVEQTGGSTIISGNITLVAQKKGLRVYGGVK